jgi:hypothetical protein
MNSTLKFAPLVLLAAAFVACPQPVSTPGGNAQVASVKVTPGNATVQTGKTVSLSAVALDAAGQPVSGVSFTWQSANPQIASVSNGAVKGIGAGTTDITARVGDKFAGAEVTVTGSGTTPPPPPGPTPPPPANGGSFSGTITAPDGGDIKDTDVIACFVTNNGCDKTKSKGLTITKTGSSTSYSLSGLTAGDYIVGAVKDMDGNGSANDPGDYYGCYGQNGDACAVVQPSKSGIDFPLTVNAPAGATVAAPRASAIGALENFVAR